MQKKLSKTALQTKQNIEDAFWKLYTQTQIEKISVTKICTIAGYNRSTFYTYYNDVYAVLDSIEEKVIPAGNFKKTILTNLIKKNIDSKKAFLKELITLLDESEPYLSYLLGKDGDPNFRPKLLAKLTPSVETILSHSFFKHKKELSYILEYQSAAITSTLAKWYANEKDLPQEEFVSLLLSLTTNGVQSTLLSL